MAYIVIQDWMISDLQLKGNELLTYSLIYGFSQDGESEFKGSLKYISEFLGVSKRTAQRSTMVQDHGWRSGADTGICRHDRGRFLWKRCHAVCILCRKTSK